jgi:hypothetical protein
MTDIEVGFTGNCDDGSLIERQLFRRASVKREPRTRPTENRPTLIAEFSSKSVVVM